MFKDKLKELVGQKVKLHIGSVENHIVWIGKIKEYESHEIYGGHLTFEHIEPDSKIMQVKESCLNLDLVGIWSYDILSDDFDEAARLSCPHCKENIELVKVRYDENGNE